MTASRGAFPFAPLAEVLARVFPEIAVAKGQFAVAGDLHRASEVLGFTRETLGRWRAGQLLTLQYADLCATRLGLHPTQVWLDFNDICDRLDIENEAAARRSVELRQARAERVKAKLRRKVAA